MKNITLSQRLKYELTDHMLPFWSSLKDERHGGFYGYADFSGKVDTAAVKGCILNARILWFFSSLYSLTGNETAHACADHAYRFLKENCLDEQYGGLYWSVRFTGEAADDKKHSYVQSFGIYALAQYSLSCESGEALALALRIFETVEEECRDASGYLEEFDRRWRAKDNDELSEHSVLSSRTMNTHLHLLEAYTTLLRTSRDRRVESCLQNLLEIVQTKMYNQERRTLKVFFDRDWNETLDIRSYGHDIEASWLIDRATEALNETHLPLTLEIAGEIYRIAYSPEGVINETVNGTTDCHRIWWVQAESVLGFINAYGKTKNSLYAQAGISLLNYIFGHFIDGRTGEWYSELDENHEPLRAPIVSAWKCPYHNGRMYIELLNMLAGMENSPSQLNSLYELK